MQILHIFVSFGTLLVFLNKIYEFQFHTIVNSIENVSIVFFLHSCNDAVSQTIWPTRRLCHSAPVCLGGILKVRLGGAIVGEYETVPGMLTARWRVRGMSTAVPLYACVMF